MNRLRLVFSLVIVLAVAGAAQATVRIGGWSFSANGQLERDFQYTGPCPVDLKFDWGVIGTEGGHVTYTVLRNDGGHMSSPQSIDLPGPNRSIPVLYDWHLGANTPQFANYSGWAQLDIQSPNPASKRINFTIHCTAPKVRVGGWALMANGELAKGFQYSGPCPVDLKFDWGLIGTAPMEVTYSFARQDGGHSASSKSVHLPEANRSVSIFDEWRLGANTPKFASYTGWVQLNVESPNTVSQKINFTIHCK